MKSKIIKQALPVLLICAIGEIIAGIFVLNIEKYLSILPGLLILVPGVMGMRGNLTGIFGSRLTSALHLGLIKPRFTKNFRLKKNIKAVLLLSVISSISIGIIAHFACLIFNFKTMGIIKFSLISFLSALISDLIIIGITTSIAFLSFKKGIDPDNILMPSSTTISDILSMLILFLVVRIVMIIPV